MTVHREKTTLAICMDFPVSERGGVSVLVETLVEDLCKYFRVLLVSSDRHDVSELFTSDNFAGHLKWDRSMMSRSYCRNFAKQLVAHGVTVAHFHGGNNAWRHRIFGYTPISFLKKNGVQIFFTNHLAASIWDGYGRALKGSIFWRAVIFPSAWFGKLHFLHYLDSEIAVSKHDRNLLERFYFPYRKKMRLIYHSRLEKKQGEGDFRGREKVILSVGHVAFRKGQHILAQACGPLLEKRRDWKLLIVGHNADPDCWTMIGNFIKENHWEDQVFLLGARDDAMILMRSASIFVQPSISEPLGLALQEALFYGCACIGTKVGGIPEMIDHDINGLLVDSGDVGQMSRSIQDLIDEPEKRMNLSVTGHRSILERGMTREGMVKAYLDLYASFGLKSAEEKE